MAKNIDFDLLTNNWVLSKFMNSGYYDKSLHGDLIDLMIINIDSGWECGCYSEYTRDDRYMMTATIHTKAGEVEFPYGSWGDLPKMILELQNMEDLAEVCSVERYEEDRGW